MRARTLKPAFFREPRLAALEPHGRLLLAGLWLIADREGRLLDEPRSIGAQLFPYERVDTDRLLNALVRAGYITRYRAGGKWYIEVRDFSAWQTPNIREPVSRIPAMEVKEEV